MTFVLVILICFVNLLKNGVFFKTLPFVIDVYIILLLIYRLDFAMQIIYLASQLLISLVIKLVGFSVFIYSKTASTSVLLNACGNK